jgi:non-specific protein-tyrosine kinase
VIVGGTLLSGVMALLVSLVIPPEFKATAQLFITPASNPTAVYQDVVLGQNLARSYAQLASAEVVLTPAMATVGWTDLKTFRERTQVQLLRETSVITVSFRASDPDVAAQAANAIAQSFITQSRALQQTLQGSTTTELEDQIAAIRSEIRDLDRQILDVRAELVATPKPNATPSTTKVDLQAQLIQLDSSRQSRQQTYAQLLKTRDDLRLSAARAENTVSLWQPAARPLEPESPRPLLNAILGALAGLTALLVTIGVVSYLDERITDPEELRSVLGVASLGQVNLADQPEVTLGKLFVRQNPTSREAESFRSVRTSLTFTDVDSRARTILITSARAGEGKSIVSANLALAFAEAGVPTILVDADLRRPSQHRLFRVSAAQGLTTLLTDQTPFNPQLALRAFQVSPLLFVIPSGPIPPNPAELLASARMSRLVEQLKAVNEQAIVIIDTSPVLAVADPVVLSTKVDACVLVIDSGATHTGAARRAIIALRRVRAVVAGAVLNKVSESESYYYQYDYGPRRAVRERSVEAGATPRRTG